MVASVYETWLRRAGLAPVAGVDEAGRGACAGPLVAAAVVLAPERPIEGLADSKTLSARQRARLHDLIVERAAAVAWAEVSPAECDRWGLQEANRQALRRAAWRLPVRPAFIVVDGLPVDGLPGPGLSVWKGDRVVECVSAASIVAKVTRDRLMDELDARYPGYGFARHKGYGTAAHQARIEALGPSAVHRWSYANVAAAGGRGAERDDQRVAAESRAHVAAADSGPIARANVAAAASGPIARAARARPGSGAGMASSPSSRVGPS